MEIRDTRNGEWHWVYNALLSDPHLTAGEKLVYSSISTFGGHQIIHPTKEQLAERCSLDDKTVQRSLKRLEEIGYISIEKSVGRGNANVYYLLKMPKGCKLCPFIKGDNLGNKRGHLEPEKGTETTPYKDIYKDKQKNKENLFSPPSFDDVKSYCNERNNGVDAEQFVNFYEAKGWMVGKNKMKDWRAAVRTWERRGEVGNNQEIKIPEYAKKYIK